MVISWFLILIRKYHWIPEQIDGMEIDMFWDLFIVEALEQEQGEATFIDQLIF